MNEQIFISYSSKDATIANQIVEYLEANGQTCWIAPRNITPGRDYTDMINEAISNCKTVVVVISKKSVQSQWVKKELTTATSMNKLIIPFKITQVELSSGWHFLLNNVQWIEATQNPTSKFPEILGGIGHAKPTTSVVTVNPKPKRYVIIASVVGVVAAIIVAILVFAHSWSDKKMVVVGTNDTISAKLDSVSDSPSIKINEEQPQSGKKNDAVTSPSKKETSSKTENTISTPATEPVAETNVSDVESEAKVVTAEDNKPETIVTDSPQPPKTPEKKAKDLNYAEANSNAKRLYENREYAEALKRFEELAAKKPSDKEVTVYISLCREQLAQHR